MTDSGEHQWESERSRKASQSGAVKGGEAAPVDVPWQDEDFARISRIDAKQKSKRRKRKAAPETRSTSAKSTNAKPAKAEPATADPLPASKAATPAPTEESFTGPRLDPPNRRPSQAPVTEVRDIRHGAGPSFVPAGLLLLAAVGVGAVLTSQMTADLPSKLPNLVSSTEPSPARHPLDQAFTDKAATPRAAQPHQEHEVASLPPPAAASGEGEKSVPPAADVRRNDPAGQAAESPAPPEVEPGTVEAEPENKEQQRAVSQPPPASGEAAPQSAERAPAPRELASAEATLEPPEAPTTPSPAGSEMVAEVQTRLSTLGYAPGPADGALREQTRDAIRAFQTDAGLPSTGEIDSSLVARLRRTEQVHWRFSG